MRQTRKETAYSSTVQSTELTLNLPNLTYDYFYQITNATDFYKYSTI